MHSDEVFHSNPLKAGQWHHTFTAVCVMSMSYSHLNIIVPGSTLGLAGSVLKSDSTTVMRNDRGCPFEPVSLVP